MNKICRLHLAFIVTLTFIVTACSVSSKQLKRFGSSDEQPKLQNYYWDVTYDRLSYRLIAIEMPNGTLFADKLGNSLFFDGWSINSIVGFGDFDGEYEIEETDIGSLEFNDEKSFIFGNSCGEWNEIRSDNGLIYKQPCGTPEKFVNRIYVNTNGEVTQIQQFLEPFNKLMTLKKQNLNQ